MADDSTPTESADSADDDDSVTASDDMRWVYLGSTLSIVLTLSLVVLVVGGAAGYLALSAISQPWYVLYALCVLTAVGWVFGKELVNKWSGK